MAANERQVGGDHYKDATSEELWDRVARKNLDFFQASIIKYVERWKAKNGVQDLEKARHYLEKYLEVADLYLARHQDMLLGERAVAQLNKVEVKDGD